MFSKALHGKVLCGSTFETEIGLVRIYYKSLIKRDLPVQSM